MIRTPAGLIVRALLAALFFTGAFAVVGVVVPAGAGAFASIEGPPMLLRRPGVAGWPGLRIGVPREQERQ